jgi:hypothetical protein
MQITAFKNLAKMMTAPLRERGFRETLRSAHGLVYAMREEKREAFDERFGTDTCRHVTRETLLSTGDDVQQLWRYFATLEAPFRRLLRALPIDFADHTFIDLGSGKGKALLMASDLPWRRIVGVELAPALHEVAQRNVALYRSPAQRCTSFELWRGDAAKFVLPPGNLVVYLFQPFPADTMAAVMDNVKKSIGSGARVALAYMNPLFDTMIRASGIFELYEHRDASAPGELGWSIYLDRKTLEAAGLALEIAGAPA